MLQALRRRIAPSTVIATLALVFAITGGAYAANHFLITSTKQISPKVLKALKGNSGAPGVEGVAGATGAAGPQGPGGAQGPQGPQGPKGETGAKGEAGPKGEKGVTGEKGVEGKEGKTGFTETLPSGKTEKGAWSVSVPPAYAPVKFSITKTAISFVIPLATEPTGVFLKPGEGGTPECPGTASNPEAAEGFLCVYAATEVGAGTPAVAPEKTFGAIVGDINGEPGGIANGSWAVTAK